MSVLRRPSLERAIRSVVVACCVFAVLIGIGILLTRLKVKFPGAAFFTANPLAALFILAAAGGLWLLRSRLASPLAERLGRCCGWVLAFGGLGLWLVLLMPGLAPFRPDFPDMAVDAAATQIFLGLALATHSLRWKEYFYPSLVLGAIALVSSLLSLVVLIFDLPGFSFAQQVPGSFAVALSLAVLSAGLLASRPDRGAMVILTSDSLGGYLMRQILPVALGAPLIVGWLRLKGEQLHFYDLQTGVALSVVCNIALLLAVIWRSAQSLHRVDEEQQKTRQRLQHAEKKYRSIFENAIEGIFQMAPDGRLIHGNPALARLYGYDTPEELLQASAELDRQFYVDPAVRAHFIQSVEQKGAAIDFETQIRRLDGTTMWVSKSARAQRDAEGQVLFYEGTMMDITRRKMAEEAVLRSERRFQTFMNNNPAVVFMKDQQGRYIYANNTLERVFGVKKEDVIGKTDFEWLPKNVAEELWANDQKVLATGEMLECIEHTPSESGVDRWWFSFKFLIEEPNGKKVVAGVSLDITERQEAELALTRARDLAVQSTRLKSEFLANMSHEIRTPMNGIIGMAGLLLETKLDARQREFARTIDSSADSLMGIINDILDFSKIEAGMLRFEQVDFDLYRAVEDSVALLAERASSKGLELLCEIHPDVPRYVVGDPGRLRQVLTNLLGNAVKFTEIGEVFLKVGCLGMAERVATLSFSVEDTGIGLDQEQIGRLFQPFAQADGSTTRKYGGTGLGLAICKELVGHMEGEITVEAMLGSGSTFRFTAQLPVQKNPAPETPEAPATDLAGLRVLIVDDNASNRNVLSHQLASWGMITTEARDAAAALHLMELQPPAEAFQMAILDMQMPEMDGLMLARRIKANPALAATKLILLTSLDRTETEQDLLALGFHGYLPKPVRQAGLRELLLRIAGAPGAVPLSSATAMPLQPSVGPARLLIAEDNPVNQSVALHQLARLGFNARTVHNGQQAVDLLVGGAEIDVILMDCQMPVLDGYEAAKKIKQLVKRRVWIIAMTAHSLPGDRDKCLAAGMDDYLSKPVTLDALRGVMGRTILSKPPETRTVLKNEQLPANLPVIQEGERSHEFEDPEFFEQIVELFIADTPHLLAKAEAAVKAADGRSLHRVAHTLKGSCSYFGAARLQEISGRLEAECALEFTPACAGLLRVVCDEYEVLKQELLLQTQAVGV